MSMLSPDDLAYMRETQAETRPTEAVLLQRTQAPSASGGRTDTWSDPAPLNVRLDGQERNVPEKVTGLVGTGKAVKITADLVDIRVGDIIRVGVEDYQVVTDGDPDEWATAQVVWAKRTKMAPRVAS